MLIKVYNLGEYINKLFPGKRGVVYPKAAIVQCNKGVLIFDEECCGAYYKSLKDEINITLVDENMVWTSNNEDKFKISLEDIINKCDCNETRFDDYVTNKYKSRIQKI